MSDAFYGEIRLFPYTFPPQNWAYCVGQSMPAQQNPALFSIVGYTYGGNPAQQVFNLPNLQGMVPIGMGQGPGLTPRVQGTQTPAIGSNSVALSSTQLPSHTHTVTTKIVGSAQAKANMAESPADTNNSWLSRAASITTSGSTTTNVNIFNFTVNGSPDTTFPAQTVSTFIGGGQNGVVAGHENRQPYLAMNFCICTYGLYPVRN